MTLMSAPRRIRQIALLAASLMIAAVTVAQTDEFAEAGKLFRGGQQAQALERVDNFLKANPKDARGRFLKGLILTEQAVSYTHPEPTRLLSISYAVFCLKKK